MQYEEFVERLTEEMKARMPGREIIMRKITKNNGGVHDGMAIHEGGEDVSPVMYIDRFFEEGKSVEEAADLIAAEYDAMDAPPAGSLSWLLDFGKVKDRIVYRVVNRDRNRVLLEEVPHKDFVGDLAVVFACVIWADDGRDGIMLVRNKHMETWKTDPEELYELADKNTRTLLGVSMKKMEDLLAEMNCFEDCTPHPAGTYSFPMYVLTNSRGLNGASCLLYPGLLEELGKTLGDDFYVLPSSLHESILLPAGHAGSSAELAEMIREVNRTQVPEEEVLSDRPYFYSREKSELLAA